MPWIVRTDYEPPHACQLPDLDPTEYSTMGDPTVHYTYPAGPGSIWECDDCHKFYSVEIHRDHTLHWMGPLPGHPSDYTVEEVNWDTLAKARTVDEVNR